MSSRENKCPWGVPLEEVLLMPFPWSYIRTLKSLRPVHSCQHCLSHSRQDPPILRNLHPKVNRRTRRGSAQKQDCQVPRENRHLCF